MCVRVSFKNNFYITNWTLISIFFTGKLKSTKNHTNDKPQGLGREYTHQEPPENQKTKVENPVNDKDSKKSDNKINKLDEQTIKHEQGNAVNSPSTTLRNDPNIKLGDNVNDLLQMPLGAAETPKSSSVSLNSVRNSKNIEQILKISSSFVNNTCNDDKNQREQHKKLQNDMENAINEILTINTKNLVK